MRDGRMYVHVKGRTRLQVFDWKVLMRPETIPRIVPRFVSRQPSVLVIGCPPNEAGYCLNVRERVSRYD